MVHCKQFRQVELYWYTVNLNNPTHKRLSESFAEVNFAFVKFCNCVPKIKNKYPRKLFLLKLNFAKTPWGKWRES